MRPVSEMQFAVVDVETTGFAANRADRIIEIAVLRVTADGTIHDEYVSLINPGRDLGPTHVHGITGADVLDAPRFSDVAGDVVSRMANAVIVGHNVRFDSSFVAAEFERAGHPLPSFPSLCTLALTSTLGLGLTNRQLAACCAHFGIQIDERHSAGCDARATSQLLAACLCLAVTNGLDTLELLGCHEPFPTNWPSLPVTGRSHRRGEGRAHRSEPHYLSRLVTQLMGMEQPHQSGRLSADIVQYLALLDRVLEDRLVTETEAGELLAVARQWGLSGERVCECHRTYLRELACAALADGVVTESERRDLLGVSRLLGFDNTVLDSVLSEVRTERGGRPAGTPAHTHHELISKSVCFTGALACRLGGEAITRENAQQLAEAAGLIVADGVTKSLDVLVVADPNSLSSKAEKARKYGTRIMAEQAFWRSIGVSVD
ncbi:MAG TPA: exonuclease domain-containing protein [Pirellulales bacterium]